MSLRSTLRLVRGGEFAAELDVELVEAGGGDFFFSLLVIKPETSPLGVARVAEYSDFSSARGTSSTPRTS